MTEEQSVEHSFVSLASRTKWVSILLCLNIVFSLVEIHFSYSEYSLYSKIAEGELYAPNEVNTLNRLQALITILSFAIYITTVFFFLVWIRRANLNLKPLGIENPEYSPRWAVWGFFIPFINLVRPYQVMKELWSSSAPTNEGSGNLFKSYSSSTPILLTWWIIWIGSNYLANLSFGKARSSTSIDDYLYMAKFGFLHEIAFITAGALCIYIVNEIKTRQEQRYAQMTSM